MFSFLDKNKTFCPPKKYNQQSRRYNLHKHAKATLGRGSGLEAAVGLPEGEDRNEWLAVHVIDFYNKTNLIVGALKDLLKKNRRKMMTAGPFEYRWKDNGEYKRATLLPAIKHIQMTMKFIETRVNDVRLFPDSDDGEFPRNFRSAVKEIFKKMFRIYAHLLYEYYAEIGQYGIEAHVATTLKHLVFFSFEFRLLKRVEYQPLRDWILENCGAKYRNKLPRASV